jgi:UDP-glucose 6-dehydrogenase
MLVARGNFYLRISVIGTCYLGATHAACLAHMGHDVLGVDALAPHLDRPALIVGTSTVPVGTAEELAEGLRNTAPAGDWHAKNLSAELAS